MCGAECCYPLGRPVTAFGKERREQYPSERRANHWIPQQLVTLKPVQAALVSAHLPSRDLGISLLALDIPFKPL